MPQDQPTGVYAGTSRQQWHRNGRAIKNIVSELSIGETSADMATVMLASAVVIADLYGLEFACAVLLNLFGFTNGDVVGHEVSA
jgi:hypothetical protein